MSGVNGGERNLNIMTGTTVRKIKNRKSLRISFKAIFILLPLAISLLSNAKLSKTDVIKSFRS